MRCHDIVRPLTASERAELDRLCSPDMPADVRAEIESSWVRDPPSQLDSDLMAAMYGDSDEEKLKLRKLRAEVVKIEAEAAKIAAEADDHRRGSSRRS